MSQTNPVKTLSVKELFDSKTQYVIPLYQRNYAWGAPEIEQLIQDICDAAELSTQSDETVTVKQENYYLGSLVVYQRTNSLHLSNVEYETIDGQQRHTTLSILLTYLKRQNVLTEEQLKGLKINLAFDSRPKSSRALEKIYTGKDELNSEPEEPAISAAYKTIERYFKTKPLDDAKFEGTQDKLKHFACYLLENVIILRVAVPPKTDLNHYFEIMNNRGEQLEKHEVLKAKFMGELGKDKEASSCFATIWDACSNMTRYTQMGFQSDLRNEIFGDDWQTMPESFEAIQEEHTSKLQNQDAIALGDIIKQRSMGSNRDDDEREKQERFGSVIDFSNFLLHVLKLVKEKENDKKIIPLDDKKLLDAFVSKDKDSALIVDAKKFAYEMLKYRILFDSYIVKSDQQNEGRKWSLLKINHYSSSDGFGYVNSFGQDEERDVNDKIRMILAMFHVSYPALVYKNWLNDALHILNDQIEKNGRWEVNGCSYLVELERLSDRYFKKITGTGDEEQLAFKDDGSGILHQGTGVQNFIFNRLDYLLWKKLFEDKSVGRITEEGECVDINKGLLGKHFTDFQFSFRTSVEHYFPQTDPSGVEHMGKKVDRFGNLCLISPSSNSKLSNYFPNGKKAFYQESNRTESLKQAIMMQYDVWGPESNKQTEKGYENIAKHEAEMIKVLCEMA